MSEQPNRRTPPGHQCGHESGCTNPATHQYPRDATPDEATAHWDALETNIRESGNPDYTQNRNDTVAKAEFRCDNPDHAHPDHLAALQNQGDASKTA